MASNPMMTLDPSTRVQLIEKARKLAEDLGWTWLNAETGDKFGTWDRFYE